jgi:hypothetical protein
MSYLKNQRNIWNRTYLSKSAYQVKRAALFHFFRCQNGSGYPDPFRATLNNYLKGFFRVLVNRKSVAVQQIRDGGTDNDFLVMSHWNQVSFFLIGF